MAIADIVTEFIVLPSVTRLVTEMVTSLRQKKGPPRKTTEPQVSVPKQYLS